MSTKVDRILTVVLSIAVVGMAAVVVRREFFPPTVKGAPPAPPTYEAAWRTIADGGAVQGSLLAPVVIIEFADLQCPGCRAYQKILDAVHRKFGDRVAVSFVHFPLNYHEHAMPAARGAECAGLHGSFQKFVGLVYAKQESLGTKSMWQFAEEAGVEDSVLFARCLAETALTDSVINKNVATANGIKVDLTPTIVVNGWRFKSPPSEYYLKLFIEDLLEGRGPAQP